MLKKSYRFVTLFMVLAAMYLSASPTKASAADVRSDARSEIDATNKNDGYIRARIKSETEKKLKLRTSYAKSDGAKIEYTYDLSGNSAWETYSLQSGNGEYTISILENVAGGRYSVIQRVSIEVEYSRENVPFLVSAKNVSYTAESNAVKKAEELIKGAATDLKKVENIYKYIVETITYDTAKANRIASGEITGYLPEIDDTLKTSKGICFDYSSLFAAMLRSQGIPAKLIMGYVAITPRPAYHAWNEVYIENAGWIKIRSEIYFDGKEWKRADATFASSNTAGKRTQFISDDRNYTKDKEF
jgi:transglutaminase/protease-like cytokinesis protein 3